MKEYIEKDKPFSLLKNYLNKPNGQYSAQEVVYLVDDLISDIPAADVEVVRCKDCKWYQESKLLAPNKFCFRLKGKDGEKVGYNFADDDFCSHGERKGGTSDGISD